MVTSIGYNYRHAPAVERVRELVMHGDLGRITNVRAVFFNGYASEPKGALSWRFIRDLAGAGALGDLLSHVVDLVQYVLGQISDVSALTSTVYTERPILPMGSGTHFAVIEDGEMGTVENDDYVAALVRFAPDSRAAGAVGTLEASRIIVGPQCGLGFEIYGTDGSATWNFEQMNELRVCIGRGGPQYGYTTVLGNAHFGDYAQFQPGPGNSMGYDDLKVIEAKKFLVAVAAGSGATRPSMTPTMSPRSSRPRVARPRPARGSRFRRCPLPPSAAREVMAVDPPVVIALGAVDPAWSPASSATASRSSRIPPQPTSTSPSARSPGPTRSSTRPFSSGHRGCAYSRAPASGSTSWTSRPPRHGNPGRHHTGQRDTSCGRGSARAGAASGEAPWGDDRPGASRPLGRPRTGADRRPGRRDDGRHRVRADRAASG